MWFAGINHPYYPEIYLCDTEQKANDKCAELLKEHHVDDGQYDGFVVKGKVSELVNIKTHY